MEFLKFKKGLENNLPQNLEKDTFYISTDTKKIRLNDAMWEDSENIKKEIYDNNFAKQSDVLIVEKVTANALNKLNTSINEIQSDVLIVEEVTANALNELNTSINEIQSNILTIDKSVEYAYERINEMQSGLTEINQMIDVNWGENSSINDYYENGMYHIKGERLNLNDGLPIDNSNPGHTIDAQLFVMNSSLIDNINNDDKCVTQVLFLSNRVGQDGNAYIRTGSGYHYDSLQWGYWASLQKNVNVGQTISLDSFIDNGMYSGVYYSNTDSPFFETFVLVTLNNYAVASQFNETRNIAQIKFGVNLDGTITTKKRLGYSLTNDDEIKWGKWIEISLEREPVVNSNSEVKSLGYKILSNSESFSEQVVAANTIYEIRDSFDLYGKTITIPENCILKFEGGKLSNGTIIGDKTILCGNVMVDKLHGSFNCEIKSSFSNEQCNYAKLRMLLNLTIDTLILDENFYISEYEEMSIITSNINNVIGNNITIEIDNNGGDFYFVKFNNINNLKGICFDFKADNDNINDTKGDTKGIGVNPNQFAEISNIIIKNVKVRHSANLLAITTKFDMPSALTVKNIMFDNVSLVTNSNDNLNSLLITVRGANSHINVSKITINKILAYNTNGILDFTKIIRGVYVFCDGEIIDGVADANTSINNNSEIVIDGIIAVDGGGMIVNTECKYVTVRNIQVKMTVLPTNTITHYAIVTLSNRDNSIVDGYGVVDNLQFEGMTNIVVLINLPNGLVSNVVANIIRGYSALIYCNKKLTISNCIYKGYPSVLFENLSNVLDINADNIEVRIDYDPNDVKNYLLSCCLFNTNYGAKLNIKKFKTHNITIVENYSNSVEGENDFIFDGLQMTSDYINGSYFISFGRESKITILNSSFNGYCRGIMSGSKLNYLLMSNINYNLLGTTQAYTITYGMYNANKNDGYYCFKDIHGTVASIEEVRLLNNNYYGEYSSTFKSLTNEYIEFQFYNVDFRTPILTFDTSNGERVPRKIYWKSDYYRAGNPASDLADTYIDLPSLYGVKTKIGFIGASNKLDCEYRNEGWHIINGTFNTLTNLKKNNIPLSKGTSVFVDDIKKTVWWDGNEWVETIKKDNFETLQNKVVENEIVVSDAIADLNEKITNISENPQLLESLQTLADYIENNGSDSYAVIQFLEQLYTKTNKTNAVEVANYIIENIENNKKTAENASTLALRQLYIAAGAEYNDSGADITKTAPWGESVTHKAGHYYLNGLGDITEEQMIEIYKAGFANGSSMSSLYEGYTSLRTCLRRNPRNNYPRPIGGYNQIDMDQSFQLCSVLETINITGTKIYVKTAVCAFQGCIKLVRIHDILDFTFTTNKANVANIFVNCLSLESIRIKGIKVDISFSDSPSLNKESLVYIIQNAIPTSAITITLHADTYSRLKDDVDIIAALNEKNGYIDENGETIQGSLPSGASINLITT